MFVTFKNHFQFGHASYATIEELEELITALIHDGFSIVSI